MDDEAPVEEEVEMTLTQFKEAISSFIQEMEEELEEAASLDKDLALMDAVSASMQDDLASKETASASVDNDEGPLFTAAEIDEIVAQAMEEVAAEEAEKKNKLARAYKFLDGTINWVETRDSIIDDLFMLADVAPGRPLYKLNIPEKRALLTLYAQELGVDYPDDWFPTKRVIKVKRPRSA